MIVSFRDPAGHLLDIAGRIIRIVNSSGISDLQNFISSKTSQKFAAAGLLVRTEFLDDTAIEQLFEHSEVKNTFDGSDGRMIVEHERVPFQSYPYEWPPEMLYQAGKLTLDLAESLLTEDLGLKDSTPYNVLFRGPKPVFIDLLSFERRDRFDPIWLSEAQFIRSILLPLLLNKHFGLRLDQILTTRRDGLEPEEAYRWCGPFQKLRSPFLTLVSIPTWLASRHRPDKLQIYQRKRLGNSEKARFILAQQFKRLRRNLKRVAPVEKKSAWSDYMKCEHSQEYFVMKEAFVKEVLAEFKPKRILDVGCNVGYFSMIAARSGASVVAIDQDATVVGEAWRKTQAEDLNILPLVIDLTRPSPGTGWLNQECPAFLERAREAFDAVLMLALIHHMLVNERIPLAQIMELAAGLTTDMLIIEFIAPDDPMFRQLARGRDNLFTALTRELFEAICQRHFEIKRFQLLARSGRYIYLLRKKALGRHA